MFKASRLPLASAGVAFALLVACQGGARTTADAPSPRVDPAVAAARQALANEAALDVRSVPDRTIAVPALSVSSADTSLAPLGFGLADMMVTDLSRSAQVTLVERGKLNALLREMAMVGAGQVDTAHAPRVGRLIGARRLVVGSITDLRNGQFAVQTQLVNTPREHAISARAPLASIFDAEKQLVYRVFEEMGVTLTPAERAAIEQRPTQNAVALLAYSRGVRDEARGQYEAAAADFRAAVQADPNFGIARQRLQTVSTTQQVIAGNQSGDVKPAGDATKSGMSVAPSSTSGGAAASALGAINLEFMWCRHRGRPVRCRAATATEPGSRCTGDSSTGSYHSGHQSDSAPVMRRMMHTRFRFAATVAAVTLLTLGAAPRAAAQDRLVGAWTATSAAYFENWSLPTAIGTTTVSGSSVLVSGASQLTVPVSVFVPVAPGWSVDAYGAWVRSEVRLAAPDAAGNKAYYLDGLTDTRVRVVGQIIGESLLFTAGLNAPTGATRLSSTELTALQVLSLLGSPDSVPHISNT